MLNLLLILFIGIEVNMPTWFWIIYGLTILVKTIVVIILASLKISEAMED